MSPVIREQMASAIEHSSVAGPHGERHSPAARSGCSTLLQATTLVGLTLWAFRNETVKVLDQALSMPEAAHALCLPVLVSLLIFARRKALSVDLREGSYWGVLLILAAVFAFALATWPFYFGFFRKMQFVTAFGGIALAVGGWRVLWRCLPILFLVAIAQPIGWNEYASLIIKPETVTLELAARMLDALPDTIIELNGPDLSYLQDGMGGAIALGDPHRGFALPLTYLSLAVFVIFSRVRPLWQVLTLGALAIPIVLSSNMLRLLLHALITIQLQASPLDGRPRDAAIMCSLVFAYVSTAACAGILKKLFVSTDSEQDSTLPGVPTP